MIVSNTLSCPSSGARLLRSKRWPGAFVRASSTGRRVSACTSWGQRINALQSYGNAGALVRRHIRASDSTDSGSTDGPSSSSSSSSSSSNSSDAAITSIQDTTLLPSVPEQQKPTAPTVSASASSPAGDAFEVAWAAAEAAAAAGQPMITDQQPAVPATTVAATSIPTPNAVSRTPDTPTFTATDSTLGASKQDSSKTGMASAAAGIAEAAAAAVAAAQARSSTGNGSSRDGSTQPSTRAASKRPDSGAEEDVDLSQEAQRYHLVSLAMFGFGCVLLLAPGQFMEAALRTPPSGLEVHFARLSGLALVFRGLLAQTLKRACERGRLHGTTSQRVVLGCILPVISHYIAFRAVMSMWGLNWSYQLMALYPTLLGAEFYTHMLAFQVYHPHILTKMLFPVAATLLIHQVLPPAPPMAQALPKGLTPVTAGAAVLLSKRGLGWLARGLSRLAPVAAKGTVTYFRKQMVSKTFKQLFPAAGPPLTGTVVKLMDFLLPTTTIAWGYWFIMLQHFATMFYAYLPELLYVGEVTPVSRLLKQTWSASFLAAAFAADALKTAADRNHLALQENRQINLCLALLEAGYAACLAYGMLNGAVVLKPYSYVRLASAIAALLFCLGVWYSSQHQAEVKGWPVVPTISSYEWQQATEKKREYHIVTSSAVIALNIITSCI